MGSTYRFGRFELNSAARQLLVDKRPAKLGARAFDVLLVLVERRDRLVTKTELLDAVWPGLFVEENNLQVHISTLRKLLGSHAIATIPGRGYRFTLPFDTADEMSTVATSISAGVASFGQPSPHVCPRCGAVVAAGVQFCGNCGAGMGEAMELKAPAAVIRPEAPNRMGERRQLTVLFADLVGATALSGQLDPEALGDILLSYQRVTNTCVEAYGGCVHQYLGDGVLAYFGYPAAHDNDAERAVLAGLALVAAVSKLSAAREARGEVGIQARIGVHTGLVVVGAVAADGSARDLAIGETPNLATRIQGEAAPNSVCISAATRNLLGPQFKLRELEPRPLKGVAKATAIFAVESGSDLAPDWEVGRNLPPLVGRDSDLQQLLQRWKLAKDGQGQAVLISGEAGIGKSRLLAALRAEIAPQEDTWRLVRCSPFYANNALHPIIDLIERAINAAPRPFSVDRERILGQLLSDSGIDDEVSRALIASLLSLGDANVLERTLVDLAPMQRRQRTSEALIAWLQADARRQPVVMVVEDLHWADPSSRDLFGMLLERMADWPVLLVMTFRSDFVPPWPLRAQVSTMPLARLTSGEVLSISRSLTAGLNLPPSIVDEIVRRTDGVPLFVEELTKAIMAAGLVVERGGALHVADATADLSVLPASLRDSLTARLDRLGSAKGVAQLASVFGREFDFQLLHAVSDMPVAELEEQLAILRRADIFQQSGMPPRAQYRFKHALLQEAAYDTLLNSVRTDHHRRVAEAYVARFPEVLQTKPELAAHHFGRASMPHQAAAYWRQAGELALGRSGHEEAISHLGAGLGQIERMPISDARAAAELGLRVALGPALLALMGFGAAEAGENYARACALSDSQGESSDRFAAKWGDWLFKNTRGQLVAAMQRSQELVDLGRTLADDGYLLQAHHSRWTNFLFLGQVADARADAREGIRLFDPIRHRHHKHLYGGHDPYVCARNFGASAACAMGCANEARRLLAEALSISRDLNHTFTLTLPLLTGSVVFHELGDVDSAGAAAEELLDVCERNNIVQWMGIGRTALGATLSERGNTDAGIAMVETGLELQLARGPVGFALPVLAIAARAHLRGGSPERALALLVRALELGDRTQVGWQRPEIERLRAETMLRMGHMRIEEAAVRLRAAADLAHAQGAEGLEARTLTSILRLCGSNSRVASARRRLQVLCDSLADQGSFDIDVARSVLADAA